MGRELQVYCQRVQLLDIQPVILTLCYPTNTQRQAQWLQQLPDRGQT